jgi:hypothetical protein
MTKKVRLFLQILPDDAMRVIGSLWARGSLSHEQYERNMNIIDAKRFDYETKRNRKLADLIADSGEFYRK